MPVSTEPFLFITPGNLYVATTALNSRDDGAVIDASPTATIEPQTVFVVLSQVTKVTKRVRIHFGDTLATVGFDCMTVDGNPFRFWATEHWIRAFFKEVAK